MKASAESLERKIGLDEGKSVARRPTGECTSSDDRFDIDGLLGGEAKSDFLAILGFFLQETRRGSLHHQVQTTAQEYVRW